MPYAFRFSPILTLVLLIFTGCRSTVAPTNQNPKNRVFLSDSHAAELLPMEFLEMPMEEIQQITGRYGDSEYNLYVYVLANHQEMSLVGLVATGQELFDISLSSDRVKAAGAMGFDKSMSRYILMDFQIVFFQAGKLRSHFRHTGLTFTEDKNADGYRRRLFDGDTLILEIIKVGPLIHLNNFLRGYSYEIQRGESGAAG